MENNKKWISKFSIRFYLIFITISLLGNIFLDLNSISIITYILLFIGVSSFIFGTFMGGSNTPVKIGALNSNPRIVVHILLCLSMPCLFLGWFFMIKYYGGLSYIFQYAMNIREETIGDGLQIIPTIVSYMTSFMFVGVTLSLSIYHQTQSRKDLLITVMFCILIVLFDLQSFGRIGMLYVIFLIVSYIILFRLKIPKAKISIYGIILYLIFMLPRYFRGGGTIDGIADEYTRYYKIQIPVIFSSIVSVYCYYFVGIYAFNELIIHDFSNYRYGERNFASLVNICNRFFSGSDHHRVSIIADFAKVPFETNIYTIFGEVYMDFGVVGLIILPLFFGFCIGYLFQYSGIFADALKLVLLVWIFYTPIYNMFSFGAFFLAFLTLIIFVLFANGKNINYNR